MRCLLKLRESLDGLSDSERRIAEYILKSPEEALNLAISELADKCETSKSTVVRLCKSIGYSGFKELCMMLHSDLMLESPTAYDNVTVGGELHEVIKRVRDNNLNAIKNTVDSLDMASLEAALGLLEQCGRIDFYGVGNSGFIALDAQNKFMRVGKISVAQTDPHLQILTASSLRPEDLAVFISYTGETQDILETLAVAKNAGAHTISITKYGKNTLSAQTDVNLFIMSDEGFIRSGAMSSRIGLLTIIDVLFSILTARRYDEYKPFLDRATEAVRLKKHKTPMKNNVTEAKKNER